MRRRNRYLKENIEINGREYNADLLGTDYGVSIIHVHDWEAAQAIEVLEPAGGANRAFAGEQWLNDENTFNEHIEHGHALNFFVIRDSHDKAIGAILSPMNCHEINPGLPYTRFFGYFNAAGHQAKPEFTLPEDAITPLYLIPNIHYNGAQGIVFNQESTAIISFYPGFVPSNQRIEFYTIPENITTIKSNAFSNCTIESIIINPNVTTIEANAFNYFEGTICCAMENAPEGWDEHWMGNNSHIIWNYGRDPEEIERNRIAREEAARAAAEANNAQCQEKFGVDWNTLLDYLHRNGELIEDEDNHAIPYNNLESGISDISVAPSGASQLGSLNDIYTTWIELEYFQDEEEIDNIIKQIVKLFTEHPHLEDEIKAEEDRIERERQEAERRRQELQNAETVSVLKYRQVGNEITIFGCKKGREKLDIPAEINGKPVTKIAPFAFYDNKTLVDIHLPNTIEEIGKGAFADTAARIYYPKAARVYSDAFLNNTVNVVKY